MAKISELQELLHSKKYILIIRNPFKRGEKPIELIRCE